MSDSYGTGPIGVTCLVVTSLTPVTVLKGLCGYPIFTDEENEVAQGWISPRMPTWGVEQEFRDRYICFQILSSFSPFVQPHRQVYFHRFDRMVKKNFSSDLIFVTEILKSCTLMQKSIFWYFCCFHILCNALDWYILEPWFRNESLALVN